MKIKVVAFAPKYVVNVQETLDEIERVMKNKSAPEVKTQFKKTVDGWDNKPDFMSRMYKSSSKYSESIWAGGDNADQYALVNHGAKPHPIPKSGTTYMHFQWGGKGSYKSSTKPRIISSGGHSQSGGMVTMYKVNHPGFEAREFDMTIAKYYTPIFRRDIRGVFVKMAKKAASSANQQTL